jgi:FKBP-type peptidyl-prolyl cis-trans isomerase
MRVGGKRKLTVPAALAYGARGRPGIPPNADLVFEIELVAVEQVEDLKVGDGPVVRPGATVSVHYVGTLKATGTEFDSSLPGSEPFTCQLRGGPGGVIDGWVAGIPGMKVGGKRRLNIPWRMAYGEMGNGPKIPGKSDLVFEVEVVGLK